MKRKIGQTGRCQEESRHGGTEKRKEDQGTREKTKRAEALGEWAEICSLNPDHAKMKRVALLCTLSRLRMRERVPKKDGANNWLAYVGWERTRPMYKVRWTSWGRLWEQFLRRKPRTLFALAIMVWMWTDHRRSLATCTPRSQAEETVFKLTLFKE